MALNLGGVPFNLYHFQFDRRNRGWVRLYLSRERLELDGGDATHHPSIALESEILYWGKPSTGRRLAEGRQTVNGLAFGVDWFAPALRVLAPPQQGVERHCPVIGAN
jgi:hypothetical protein